LTLFNQELKNIIIERNIFVNDVILYARDESIKNKKLVQFLDKLKVELT